MFVATTAMNDLEHSTNPFSFEINKVAMWD
jgi:hypothetical protein